MSKEFYDKYGKLVDCSSCNCIEPCSKSDSPLCSEGYVFFAKDKIADLEAKLTEKEKENELMAKTLRMFKCIEKEINQDKISFAVEQLEQVRKLVDELLDDCGDKQYKVWEVFDNQIKAIKEMK